MQRKKWTAASDSPEILKFREKRKWQIALRRYTIEKNPALLYAPYFGLDITKMRGWIESQFGESIGWESFGQKWQLDHIIPVNYFDFGQEAELRLCWNFLNIRVAIFPTEKEHIHRLNLALATQYFQDIYDKTGYRPCLQFIEKIRQIQSSVQINVIPQAAFISENKSYLDTIETYSSFEFELLNKGRSLQEVVKEIEFLKKF
jgi:hypothetical protein